MLIEDDDALARGLARILGRRYQVERAGSLAEGLQMIESLGYAALICDWDLGDGIGAVALRRSLERNPNARRILHTARPPDDIATLLASGLVDMILQKPCEPRAIFAALADQSATGR